MALINKDTRLDLIRRLEDENPNDANLMDEATALAFIESMTPMNNCGARPGSAVADLTGAEYNFLVPNAETMPTLLNSVEVVLSSPYSSCDVNGTASSHLSSGGGVTELPAGTSYAQIAQMLAMNYTREDSWIRSLPVSDLSVYMLRPRMSASQRVQWREEVSSSALEPDADKYAISLRSIKRGAVLELRTTRDNVGPRMLLAKMPADFRHNSSMVAKIARLETAYSGFRRIRGDGNCYYRAVIFGLLENIVESDRRHLFRELHTSFAHFVRAHATYVSAEDLTKGSSSANPSDADSPETWHRQIELFLAVLLEAAGLRS
jgi:hypothetical protein